MAQLRAALLAVVLIMTACESEVVTLRVALYPYVPDARALFYELEAVFEARHEGVNVELVETGADYYSGGLLAADADVYEIDSVLLQDMIEAGKLAPLTPREDVFVRGALAASTIDGVLWGVPHWVCGNFLMFGAEDRAIADAATWEELVAELDEEDGLLVDLKGTSTLGEWYVTMLGALGMGEGEIRMRVGQPLDSRAVARLARALDACPVGSCRNDTYHDRPGYYARRFVRKEVRAYVGYSETLHYAVREVITDCEKPESCRAAESIAVRALPVEQDGGAAVGWVDALGMAAGLPPQRHEVALEFIEFLVSREAYSLVLQPEWGEAPRYLMPALALDDATLSEFAPLYSKIFEAYEARSFLLGSGINADLRRNGADLDCVLPGADGECS